MLLKWVITIEITSKWDYDDNIIGMRSEWWDDSRMSKLHMNESLPLKWLPNDGMTLEWVKIS